MARFKLGDHVQIVDRSNASGLDDFVGETGKISAYDSQDGTLPYLVSIRDGEDRLWMRECDIEPLYHKDLLAKFEAVYRSYINDGGMARLPTEVLHTVAREVFGVEVSRRDTIEFTPVRKG